MLAIERQEDIVRKLNEEGSVVVRDLSALYGVTEDCIRKDLAQLQREGLCKRTYGGAVKQRVNLRDLAVSSRRDKNLEGKHLLASKAFKLIHEGDMIFLDISTANAELAKLIAQARLRIVVVTTMVEVMQNLAGAANVRLVVAGGEPTPTGDGFLGSITDSLLRSYRFDIAFMGAAALDPFTDSVLTYLPEDGVTKTCVLSLARRAYLLLETNKLDNDGDYRYAQTSDFTALITDGPVSDIHKKKLDELGIEIL